MSTKARRQKRAQQKQRAKAMQSFFVKRSCGCCTDELKFESEANVIAAFSKAGLSSSVTIVDDAGVRHDGIDTFYGYSASEQEESDRSLGYLASLLE